MRSSYTHVFRPDQPKPALRDRVYRWFDEALQRVGDSFPEWMVCCGSNTMWDIVDAEASFQLEVEREHCVVYGDGEEPSLEVLLDEHDEVGYSLRHQQKELPVEDVQPRRIESADDRIVVGSVECPLACKVVDGELVIIDDGTSPGDAPLWPATCDQQQPTALEESGGPALEGEPKRLGKREWRRRNAVVSAPIVSKVVADMRAEIGMCCLSCDHANIEEVRIQCPANYQAAQWTALRLMKDRKLHTEHVQLYLLPCLVAYFNRVQFADGLGGYRGGLGGRRRRVWRRRHAQT